MSLVPFAAQIENSFEAIEWPAAVGAVPERGRGEWWALESSLEKEQEGLGWLWRRKRV